MAAPGVAAPGAPPLGTAGTVSIGGQTYHVNTAGIIDSKGPYYGKYPEQVIQRQNQAQQSAQDTTPAQQLDGKAFIEQFLAPYGLSGLADRAIQAWIQSGGSAAYLHEWLTQQPEFQARYPGFTQSGMSIDQYQQYQSTVQGYATVYGLPQGFVTPALIGQYVDKGWSVGAVQQQFAQAAQVVNQLPSEDVDYLSRELGIDKGDLTAYWINPSHSLPLLQNKLATAQIGGAATDAGINLNTDLATQLANQGVTQDQARQGFDQLANDRQLFQPLPGQQGNTLTQQQQVGGEFGTDAAAQQALAKARAGRIAPFKAGGGFASDNTGLVGAGKATGI